MSANEKQVGGNHYKMAIEPWDAIHSWDLGYFDGTAVKYLARWRNKNGVQDLEKAKHFIEKLIEIETSGPSNSENLFNYSREMRYDWNRDVYFDDEEATWESPAEYLYKARKDLESLYSLFKEMHEHAQDKHNHFLISANLVKRALDGEL
jgi:hypothetical protein